MLYGIVCVDKNWGIGKKNGLLFSLKEDMKFFKEQTTGKVVVMGENTLLSLPGQKPLKNRTNIVLCPEGHEYEGFTCIHNFDDFVAYVTNLAKTEDVFIIGGGMLYKSMLPYYHTVYVTKVDADGEAEVFFPNLDEDPNYSPLWVSPMFEDNGYTIHFWTYIKLKQEAIS